MEQARLHRLVESVKQRVDGYDPNDVASHARLLDDINELQQTAETPLDTIYRLGHHVIAPLTSSTRLRGASVDSNG